MRKYVLLGLLAAGLCTASFAQDNELPELDTKQYQASFCGYAVNGTLVKALSNCKMEVHNLINPKAQLPVLSYTIIIHHKDGEWAYNPMQGGQMLNDVPFKSLKPGDQVIIMNIVVKAPDGERMLKNGPILVIQ